ncbi:MAG TPA: NYN domain-containing protein [Miltoncostaeaceae bacterium]|nr:NYN domain-containing protein [Miltoncostaeaceae bacterium]
MNVRAYIDGFNLYYGGKALAEAAPGPDPPPSWKWLDLRALVQSIADQRWRGRRPRVAHVTYCTARVVGDRRAVARQAAYLRALTLSGCVDLVEFGLFKETYKRYPRATKDAKGRPILVGGGVPQMVGVSHREEKGSDVNLASRLLIDALTGQMDAAIVVSNDSDLSLPVREARRLMPVGTVSPHPGHVHGSLRPDPVRGSGHWYHSLSMAELAAAQMPDPCEGIRRPTSW